MAMALSIGDTIGAYQITEQVGRGGMATVYKAYHAALDRSVAIKVLHAALNTDSTFLARFQREARVVAKLDHPNIVPVYDYAEYEGSPYLVMKFIEGETLRAHLAFGALPVAETRRVIAAVSAALDYAHKQGILHRDVKPSNIMLACDGSLYLADFGLARIAQAGESTLSADSMLGTPAYMSPEQARGVKDLDARADIYSLGVVAYELMVGKVPFGGDTTFSVVHDHIFTPPPSPHFVNPQVSEAMEAVLLKALAKDRADRYADVAAFATAFDQAAAASDTTAAAQAADATRVQPAGAELTLLAARAENPPTQKVPAGAKSRTPLWVWVGIGSVALMAAVALIVLWLLGARYQKLNAQATQVRATSIAMATMAAGRTRGTATAQAQASQPAFPPTATSFIPPNATPPPATLALPPPTPPNTAALLTAAGQAFDNHNSAQGFSLLDQAVQANTANTTVLLAAGDTALSHGAEFAQQALDKYYLKANALEASRRDANAGQVAAHVALAMYALTLDPNGGTYLTDLVTTFAPLGEPRLFLDRWHAFAPQADYGAIQADLAQVPNSLAVRLVSGDVLMLQGKRPLAEREYTAVTDQWRPNNPLWVLTEAQCEIRNLGQNRTGAAAKPLCNPIGTLVAGH
jgi:tRNA A-37 threonylcarbamoyl transferase component Bud32